MLTTALRALEAALGRDGALRERPLEELLRAEELALILGKERLFYFKYVLSEEAWGLNLRNDIAHGLIKKELCTKGVVDQIIFLYMMLVPYEAASDPGTAP